MSVFRKSKITAKNELLNFETIFANILVRLFDTLSQINRDFVQEFYSLVPSPVNLGVPRQPVSNIETPTQQKLSVAIPASLPVI